MTASTLNCLDGLIHGMELRERIAESMGTYSKADFARAIGVSGSAVTFWLNGDTKSLKAQVAQKMEVITGYRADWIINGRLPKRVSNVEAGPDIRGKLPLISKVQAGNWDEAYDNFQPGDAERWMACSVRHSASSYVLRVTGDSMTAPSGNARSYPNGCYVFVDPELRNPSNGDRVIAKLAGDGEDSVTFKVYKKEDGRQWLQPLNPSHEPIRDEFTILGKVIGKWEDE